eukprot:gene19389-23181_t
MSHMYALAFTGDLSTGKPLPTELLANLDVSEEVEQKLGSGSYAFGTLYAEDFSLGSDSKLQIGTVMFDGSAVPVDSSDVLRFESMTSSSSSEVMKFEVCIVSGISFTEALKTGDTNAAEVHYSTTLNGNLNTFDPDTGATPLTIAIWHAQYGMVQWLISKGADVEWKDKSGMSPLHVASKEGHQDILELLLEQDLDINVKNRKHESPLHIATHFQQLEAVKILLKSDGIKVNAINEHKHTPLDQCKVTVKGMKIRKLLRKYGAMTSDELE